MVDADYKFTYVDVGQSGRSLDGGVLKNSSFAKALEDGELNIAKSKCNLSGTDQLVPHVLIGDDAFPLSASLMKLQSQSINSPSSRGFLTIDLAGQGVFLKMPLVF